MAEKKSLVFQTAFLGDELLAIPLLQNLRELGPVHLVCRSEYSEFFRRLEVADCVYGLNKGDPKSRKEFLRSLAREEYDYLLCPHTSFRSALYTRSISARVRVGFRSWWNAPFFHRRVKRRVDLPDALRQLSLLSRLDEFFGSAFLSDFDRFVNLSSRVSVELDSVKIPPEMSMVLEKFRDRPTKMGRLVMAPGSVWPTKMWTREGFSEIGRRWAEDSAREVVLVGSPEERHLCEDISKAIPGSINHAGNLGIFETLGVISTAEVVISNDSGAMHLASLAGVPTLAIFGPTVLELGYRPWNDRAAVVQLDLECRPCGKHGGKSCPLGTHDCMKKLTADMVWKALSELVDKKFVDRRGQKL